MLYGDNGILNKAKFASEEYKNATEEEKEELAKVDSDIQSSRETVTISKEEYESLKPKSITTDSILMTSRNENLNAIDNLNLTSFTNNFSENFDQYFSYNTTTGELTCQKDGWYCLNLKIDLSSTSTYSTTTLYTYINDIEIDDMYCTVSANGTFANDTNTITIFIKKGDIIKFRKYTYNNLHQRNRIIIKLIKL